MRQLKKPKTSFICQKCGAASPKWLGRCTECGEWGSMLEEVITPSISSPRHSLSAEKPLSLQDVKVITSSRLTTEIKEFDRILGGGIVIGSAALIGGDPGIGKSTLLLQVSNKLAIEGLKILYVSAEESVFQTKLRAQRLGISHDNIWLVSETNTSVICSYIEEYKPNLVVLDSIQMVYKPEIPSSPGTLTQVRESTMDLVYLCKRSGVSLFLVGHITKEGSIAGPKSLEHIVDTVLYFEGDRFQSFRILRTVKNRFGSTNEIGVFEMRDDGLAEVTNPSELFISSRPGGSDVGGTVIVASFIGSRPFLVEVQALTSRAYYSQPARRVSGVDFNRTVMVLAVLERRLGLTLGSQDVYVNVVGGVKIDEPAVDLGIAIAVYSSYKNKPIPRGVVFIGEVGLTGEIRAVNQIETRIQESARLGFNKVVIPKVNLPTGQVKTLNKATDYLSRGTKDTDKVEIIKHSYLSEVVKELVW
ncbi:MAG: DNA repair protein RadA [Planctomycetota bacterium]|nr:DNA repair protein RadA [Planctomycetota bacterium]MDI6787085.1 DNA repair protein RadA [Planctomycetota bacterium]